MKDTPTYHAVPHELSTPNDLDKKARKAIFTVVNPLVADSFALFVKTKNYHWHMTGSHYRDYHLLLDEQATQIFAMIDVLAERVRKLGGSTIHSIGEIARLKNVQDDDEQLVDAKEMLRRLLADNKNFTAHMRAVHKVCSEGNDVATTSLLENFIDESERRTWFLYETIAD
jgi:starvation-inducible DNA-binding protein